MDRFRKGEHVSDARIRLAEWFKEFLGETLPESDDADLFARFGIDGDDAVEFMDSFGERFEVAGENYRWYFHHGEEGANFGGFFFAPPYRRVKRVPITPDILIEAIEARRWPLEYPLHREPKVRWDIRVNQLLIVAMLILVALFAWRHVLG